MGSPIYLKIVEDFKERINSGEIKPGDMIKSENALCEEYSVSRMTVRKSLNVLAGEGYIYSVPGKGNFINEPNQDKYILYFNEMTSIESSVEDTQLLDVNIIKPTLEIIFNMQIPENKRVVLIRRVFLSDDNPVAYDIKYIPYYRGIPIVEKEIHYATFPEIVAKKKSLFAINKELKIKVQKPSEELQEILGIEISDPVMVIEQKMLDEGNRPIGWGVTYFRGDFFHLQAVSSFADKSNSIY
ncbi:GntR family transcriptional regulator [Alkalibacter mobilis]|uniref:GntR family transcriptional regulator n=1 Tax=Alkalibacter mobilis TaxID=2787712 RepID=UPI00189E8611|nr:GntR family transcriptional regulator [Alkalibacter mobilis]MBF7096542.1 GntR family transcriptional regulator [Alkalibacter mobilis]